MRDLGIGSWPRRRVRNGAERTAIIQPDPAGVRYTYADLDLRTRHLAAALRAAGVGSGDRVAYVGFNDASLLETFFAAARIGAVWVVVNARLAAAEVEYILRDSGACVVVHGEQHAALAAELAAGSLDVLRWVAVGRDYEAFLASGAADTSDLDEPVAWATPALIMYTSGTTGRPKGATHTHGSLSMQYFQTIVDSDVVHDDVTLCVAPLFHVAGLNTMAMPTLLKGGTLVIQQQFRPADVLRAVERYGVTTLFVVPAMMDALARHEAFATSDLTSLRRVLVGGAPVADRALRLWSDRGVSVQQGFGMTETGAGTFLLLEQDAHRKPGSAGRPQFWTEGRVVRPDGSDVAPGEVGEVIVKGPHLMAGYWGRPEATADAIVDGWYRTGDLATFDEDGYLFVKDRLGDMFISGGENVYPAEVENALLEITGVAEAAVVGVPDARWGEVGRAYLVLEHGATLAADDVVAALGGRLARYKVPARFEVVPELPRTATGKIQKHLLAPSDPALPDQALPDQALPDPAPTEENA